MTSMPTRVSRERLVADYRRVRAQTLALCEGLEVEDMVVQTMDDVSPTKWHLAHMTWFFETVVLSACAPDYRVHDASFADLFNSYYQALGDPFPRGRRGTLSRPTLREVLAYRHAVDAAMLRQLESCDEDVFERAAPLVEIGIGHEEQHQELLLMDALHVLAANPRAPAYRAPTDRAPTDRAAADGRRSSASECSGMDPACFIPFDASFVEVGASEGSFAYDNERPRHEVHVAAFEIAERPVTVGDYRAFIEDGAYENSDLWLADGWAELQRQAWRGPEYWRSCGRPVRAMSLRGLREVHDDEPVCHVSYYEADAFARWAGCRLPTEFEWEAAAARTPLGGNLLEAGVLHPMATKPHANAVDEPRVQQCFGDVWEWTSSPYAPYPGFVPFEGLLGEYNGKFMVNQLVLRGGSCLTPRAHLRRSYRNFFYPQQRWMMAGFRLARTPARSAA